jgi:hypothetical protein
MKKFSKVNGIKINEEPKIENKVDDLDILKLEMLNLMDNFLKVRLTGPVHNKLMFGSFSIDGKDMLAEAIITLLGDKDNKSQTKILESLKTKIKDWEVIDSEIEKINKVRPNLKNINRVSQLLEKYSSDESTLILYVESTINKFKNIETLNQYSSLIKESSLSEESKSKLINIYNQRIKQLSII